MAKKGKTEFQLKVIGLVKDIRVKKDLSQSDIAFFLSVTSGYIGQIESVNSPSKYTLDQLNKLALEMDCSPRDFIPVEPIRENKIVRIKKPSKKTKPNN